MKAEVRLAAVAPASPAESSAVLAQATRVPASWPPGAPEPRRIIVVVPTLNEARVIEACLRSLLYGAEEMARVRVVVSDGGSTDATRSIVTELGRGWPRLVLIDNPDRIQAAAINRAVRRCAGPRHDILVRCDAHSLYPPAYVPLVARSLIEHDAASVATPMDAIGSGGFQRAAAWVVDTPLGSGGSPHRGGRRSGPVDHGHHAALSLDWFRRLGGYDESFTHNEDAEYDYRLGQAGGRIWLDACIRVEYGMRADARALALQYWRYGRGRARTVLKHRTRPRLRQMIPVANVLALGGCVAIAPVQPVALTGPALYAALLAGVSAWTAARRRACCGLWAGPALAVMHLPWGSGFLRQILASVGRR